MIDRECVFCKIGAHEMPAHVIYEDVDFIAFLDIHPRAAGHTQVIPKKHYRWVWDVLDIGKYFEVVRSIAKAQQTTFGSEMIRSQVFGDEIDHAHVWVWPAITDAKAEALEENAQKLRNALAFAHL